MRLVEYEQRLRTEVERLRVSNGVSGSRAEEFRREAGSVRLQLSDAKQLQEQLQREVELRIEERSVAEGKLQEAVADINATQKEVARLQREVRYVCVLYVCYMCVICVICVMCYVCYICYMCYVCYVCYMCWEEGGRGGLRGGWMKAGIIAQSPLRLSAWMHACLCVCARVRGCVSVGAFVRACVCGRGVAEYRLLLLLLLLRSWRHLPPLWWWSAWWWSATTSGR
eukprot:GHVU01066523.1.p1 GENE.GHVU01066523.1~~GHVU01066523.1.p1  ORF type:complete len:226 (+),score=24.42 GHVU01066523.1:2-679(+)